MESISADEWPEMAYLVGLISCTKIKIVFCIDFKNQAHVKFLDQIKSSVRKLN